MKTFPKYLAIGLTTVSVFSFSSFATLDEEAYQAATYLEAKLGIQVDNYAEQKRGLEKQLAILSEQIASGKMNQAQGEKKIANLVNQIEFVGSMHTILKEQLQTAQEILKTLPKPKPSAPAQTSSDPRPSPNLLEGSQQPVSKTALEVWNDLQRKSPREVFGFSEEDPIEKPELKKKWLTLLAKYHPDKCKDDDKKICEEIAKKANEAYKVLSR